MLTITLLLFGSVLLVLVLADRAVGHLPLTPAVIYLAAGWCAGAALGAPSAGYLEAHAPMLTVATELAVLVSLFAVGLRLRLPPGLRAWRQALLLAGPGVVVAILLGTVAAVLVLQLPWQVALLLAAVMSPTDPVLASEVQIRSGEDRDAVRLALTAEGGLNDGSAFPGVMFGLGVMGLHELGPFGLQWLLSDLLWPIGAGALLGLGVGAGLGRVLDARARRGDTLARDELLYVGVVVLAYGLARATATSSFVVVFCAGAALLQPVRRDASAPGGPKLSARLSSVGGSIEKLMEAATVLCVGVALHSVHVGLRQLAYAALLVAVVRPLSVLAVVRRGLTSSQRRLAAWFGIRGVGTLFYLAFVIEHGVAGSLAEELMAASLAAIALSIVLHGVSATPLMAAYHRRRGGGGPVD